MKRLKVLFLGNTNFLNPWFSDLVQEVSDKHEVLLYDPAESLDEQFHGVHVVVDQGGVMGTHEMMLKAREAGVRLKAEFVETDRNRMMYVTYRFAGFEEVEREGDWSLLQLAEDHPVAFPAYVKVSVNE